jgi:hypothetical protein
LFIREDQLSTSNHTMDELMIRFVVGMSSGLAVCLVPPFLSVIARSTPQLASKTGLIGTMNQIGIVTGLFCGQVAGLILTGSVILSTLPYYLG